MTHVIVVLSALDISKHDAIPRKVLQLQLQVTDKLSCQGEIRGAFSSNASSHFGPKTIYSEI